MNVTPMGSMPLPFFMNLDGQAVAGTPNEDAIHAGAASAQHDTPWVHAAPVLHDFGWPMAD